MINIRYIASCSFGKDSLAMLLLLIERGHPLDEVVFYDTGMEFDAIYRNRDKILKILEENNIKFTELKPTIPFLEKAFDIVVKNRDGSGYHNGYSWCGDGCRWGTTDKNMIIEKYLSKLNEPFKEYIGIAYDEPHRIKNKIYPLVDAKMTEAKCLQFCRDRGFDWLEQTPATDNGWIDLYDILDRVSCWCCANKNRKELKNIYLYLPHYWQKLKDFQSKTDRPMKKYCNKKYGTYGNVFKMEKVFEMENSND